MHKENEKRKEWPQKAVHPPSYLHREGFFYYMVGLHSCWSLHQCMTAHFEEITVLIYTQSIYCFQQSSSSFKDIT